MLIPGKSNSRVLIETLDFARSTYFHLRDRSWIAGGGAKGRGDHWPDLAPSPADNGTPSPPADNRRSSRWCTQNGRGGDWESATAIGPRTTGQGITASPVGRRWTIGRRRGRDGRVKRRAAARSPAPWCTCQKADVQRD